MFSYFPLVSYAALTDATTADPAPINLARGDREAYLKTLIDRARMGEIWLQRQWQVLMHYSPRQSSGATRSSVTSLVDDPLFFVAPEGKTSPQAELEATLRALVIPSQELSTSTDISGVVNSDAMACRFPARLAWLRKVLDIDDNALQDHQCTHLNNWLRNLDADSVTLIFPVSVLNSPASMFGHTFLRLDKKTESQKTNSRIGESQNTGIRKTQQKPDLLAWTINYAAHANSERGIGFAYNGLLGGYPGRFTLAPYHQRVKAYSDIENRDMWEYKLNYSPEEVHAMLLHLWELLPVYFDYYFIDENCSYHLLGLLEAARPDLPLTDRFYWDATPAETVRAVTNTPGLLKSVQHRPSLRQTIENRAGALTMTDQVLAKALAEGSFTDGQSDLSNNSFLSRDPLDQAAILELATDYMAYLNAISNKSEDVFDSQAEKPGDSRDDAQREIRDDRLLDLLAARSALDVDSPQPADDSIAVSVTRTKTPAVSPPHYRPDQGHRGRRVGLRYGNEESEHYLQFDFRWAYHDLYDPSKGFINGAELEFLKPAFRYYFDDSQFKFEAIDFVNIVSAPVRSYFVRPFSWEGTAALKRYSFEDDDRRLIWDFGAGAGVSYQLAEKISASAFVTGKFNLGNQFTNNIGLGAGVKARLIYRMTNNWQGGIHTDVSQYFEGITQTAYSFGGTLRYSLDKDSVVLIELSDNREFGDAFFQGQLSWQWYF